MTSAVVVPFTRIACILFTVVVVTVIASGLGRPPVTIDAAPADARTVLTGEARTRALARVAEAQLHFERNRGQANPAFDAIATGAGYRVGLSAGGATLMLTDRTDGVPAVLAFALRGANAAAPVEHLETLPGTMAYYRGSDASDWHAGISTHARVRYAGVYDGIDIVYYGNQRRLQYDFVVAPGADPGVIALGVDGAESLTLGDDGQLVVRVGARTIEQARPFTYQEIGGVHREVPSRFLLAAGVVHFEVGDYDRSLPLVIDPVIAYSTWFGGSGEEGVLDIITTPDGGYVIYGFSEDAQGALQFPTTPGAVKPTRGSDSDVFVAKFNGDGSQLIFSTLLGGSGNENTEAFSYVGGLDVGIDGKLHVTGTTRSADFPTTAGAHDADYNDDDPGAVGMADGFYVRLSPVGQLEVSTYFRGAAPISRSASPLTLRGVPSSWAAPRRRRVP